MPAQRLPVEGLEALLDRGGPLWVQLRTTFLLDWSNPYDHLRGVTHDGVLTYIKTLHGHQRHDQVVALRSLFTWAKRNGLYRPLRGGLGRGRRIRRHARRVRLSPRGRPAETFSDVSAGRRISPSPRNDPAQPWIIVAAIEVRDRWRCASAGDGLEFFITDIARWTPGSTVRVRVFLDGGRQLHADIAGAPVQITDACNLKLDFGHAEATGAFR
ncbi:hypothetical protein [Streptomyces phaeofaciens]|uniref:hypothetical protein n=1 Tax=Streptomyces phaeofaciens TaxID=68254 RepID=UPI0036D01544